MLLFYSYRALEKLFNVWRVFEMQLNADNVVRGPITCDFDRQHENAE